MFIKIIHEIIELIEKNMSRECIFLDVVIL